MTFRTSSACSSGADPLLTPRLVEVPPSSAARATRTAGLLTTCLDRAAIPLMLAMVFVALAAWSWRRWPDLLVDFGRELYIAWQLASGKVLYRDIATVFGPLSHYWNALWFRAFGVSLATLAVANMAILAGMTALVYRLFALACDRLSATVACLTLLGMFAFSQYVDTANYNFVTPYSHEATHGTALSIAMIWALACHLRTRRPLSAALAGFLFGLALLTKVEIALAAAAAATAGAVLIVTLDDRRGPRSVRSLALFGTASALPALAFGVYFWQHMPLAEAARAVAGSWINLVGPGREVAQNLFYVTGMGLDDVPGNALLMVKAVGWIGLWSVLASAGDLLLGTRRSRGALVATAGGLTTLGLALLSAGIVPWSDLARALPIVSLVAVIAFSVEFWRDRRDRDHATRLAPLVIWATFGLALLSKMLLNTRFYHYGFYQAMPATLTLVVCVVWLVPTWLARVRGHGELFRAIALLSVAAGVGVHLGWSTGLYRLKDFVVGDGADRLVTYDPAIRAQGATVAAALGRIEAIMPKEATFVCLPEGAMLNYLSRRPNPTPYISFLPPELLIWGQPTVARALAAARPDYVVVVQRNTAEYGVGQFGADPWYGREIMTWVARHYEPVEHLGADPLRREGFWIAILKRRAPES